MKKKVRLPKQEPKPELAVGKRVIFEDPENHDEMSDQEVRGRVIHLEANFVQVIQDGRTFARWLPREKVRLEHG